MAVQVYRQFVRRLHTSSPHFKLRARYPGRSHSIRLTAAELGFETPKEMYPVYPLDEPPKFWLVRQMKTLKRRPYWEKEAMKEIGLHKVFDISVQANFPKVNEILWSVKHLVKILPIRFPQGLPTEEDIGHTQLHDDGRFVIYSRMEKEEKAEIDVIPLAPEEEYKVVDGFRMCSGCRARRCLKLGMCQKLWMQRGQNYIEKIGPQLFNFVENPLKAKKREAESLKQTAES